jgi:hypothetical protein
VGRDTPENRARRRRFCSFLTVVNADRLVFIERIVLQNRRAA